MEKDPIIYTVDEEHSHRFYNLPKELFSNDLYSGLNSDAKILYALLLDRKELSRKNGWVDEHNQVFLMYTRKNLGDIMNISTPTVTKAFKQLAAAKLIKEERLGLTKPNKIYVCRLKYSNDACRKDTFVQEENIFNTNDTDLKETEKIKRYTIQENGVRVLSYYNQRYEETFYKPHPTVTPEQLARIENQLEMNMMHRGYDEEQVLEMVDAHFENLSPLNDGKVFSFVGTSELVNPMRRYE